MKSAFQITDSSLKNLIILNSDITIHVFNDLSWFSNFWKTSKREYVIAEWLKVSILKYDNMMLQITKKNDKKKILRLKNVIFCTDFVTNLVSFELLRKKEIHWNTINNFLFWESDSSLICMLKKRYDQQMLEKNDSSITLTVRKIWRWKTISQDFWSAFKDDRKLWHAHMNHSELMSLHKLEKNFLEIVFQDSSITQCSICSQVKIKQQISWQSFIWEISRSCQKIHIDWTDLEMTYNEFVCVMFITDYFSDMIFFYFMFTHEQKRENLWILKNFVSWMRKKYDLKINVI